MHPAMPANYTVRVMSRADLDLALQWAAAEGWNPGLDDAEAFHATDPGGFLMGWLGQTPIASLSVVAYGAHYGFLGLYIVQPAFRGLGYGWALWQAGMAQLGTRAVGLDGVVAQQANYGRSGFVLAHRNIRFQGRATPAPVASQTPVVVPLAQVGWRDIVAYDRACFSASREAFLAVWLRPRAGAAVACVQAGAVAGYGVIRPCRQGYKIGPLFADQPSQAEALLQTLLRAVPEGSPVYLDVPETNPDALALAQRQAMAPMFETARMYRGNPTLPDMSRTYGITTFELG